MNSHSKSANKFNKRNSNIFKDPWKNLTLKRENALNQLINNTIKENTAKIKLEKTIFDHFQEIVLNETEKNCNIAKTIINSVNEDKLPYILIGLVESTFIDETNMHKIREYGIGIVIESNIVLVSAKNLVFDNKSFSLALEGNTDIPEVNSNNAGLSNFQLFDVQFSLLNLSSKYRNYLPSKIKVREFYTPLNLDNPDITDEEKIVNGWGLIVTETHIGDFINFVLEEKQREKDRDLVKRKNDNKNDKMPFNLDFVNIRHLDNREIETTDILFLEGTSITNLNGHKVNENNINECNESTFSFNENYYEMKFDKNLIFLNCIGGVEKEILPGVILGYSSRKYCIIGINTNLIIKINDEENADEGQDMDVLKKPNASNLSNESRLHRIAVRFNKEICNFILKKTKELKAHSHSNANNTYNNFSCKLFRLLNSKMTSRDSFCEMLKDNCRNLIEYLNSLQNDNSNTNNLSKEEKEMIVFSHRNKNYFIPLALSLIWNKISSENFESNSLNLESLNIGIDPGTDILASIIKSSENLLSLNLKGNNIFAEGLKNLIKPIYNTKQLAFVGKELRFIHLDNNKLSSKAVKYLRHLLKLCPQLTKLTLNHNYIAADGIRHLVNAMKGKESLTHFGIGYNMLGSKSGEYLGQIIKELGGLRELDLQSNNLCDEGFIAIAEQIKGSPSDEDEDNITEHVSFLENLFISNNNLTSKSASSIADLITSNPNLSTLWLNNNDLSSEGVKIISESLIGYDINSQNKYPASSRLTELNLNSVNCGPEGAESLFENLKHNRYIKKIFLNSNFICDYGCEKLSLFLQDQILLNNEDSESSLNAHLIGVTHLHMSNNSITDQGAKCIVDAVMNLRTLKELKLNSNAITDEGGELLLYAVFYNSSITKLNIENNNTTWRENNLNIKNVRNSVQIFF